MHGLLLAVSVQQEEANQLLDHPKAILVDLWLLLTSESEDSAFSESDLLFLLASLMIDIFFVS